MPETPRKSEEPTVTDLENGHDGSRNTSSIEIQGTESSQNGTPESRGRLEYQEDSAQAPSPWKRHWKTISSRIPQPIPRWSRKTVDWIKGPEPPQVCRVNPFFEKLQTFPIRIMSRLPKFGRVAILFLTFVLWVVLFGVILSQFSLPSNIGGFGAPVRLGCVSRLWANPQSCALDGRNCLPFDESSFAFSCPARCASAQVLNPWTIGDEQIIYRSLIVGGTEDPSESNEPIYRGDSFICGAAIHAEILQNGRGGCGVLSLVGEKTSYGSVNRHGISSVGFDSSFPMSFGFNRSESVVNTANKCRDPRWDLLTLSAIITTFFGIFTNTPLAFFLPVFIIVYFQIAMASDPPNYIDYPSLASTALGNFLPAAFIGVLVYQFVVRKTLHKLNASLEKTILWLGGCWVGALNNLTLEQIPLQRLYAHDIKQQPGAITALVIIVLIIFFAAIYQVWCLRKEGRLPRFIALYATMGLGLLILWAIPGLNLRLHHYIWSLMLLPGTGVQTRPSLLWQGLLVGIFINGVARWGFASILETAAALRGDAQLGRGIPSILEPVINGSSITFAWKELLRGYEGVSVLVNDVERFRGFHKDGDNNFTWTRSEADANADKPEFFRFGFVNYLPFGTVSYSDFTRAGTWWPNGTWTDIPPGLS